MSELTRRDVTAGLAQLFRSKAKTGEVTSLVAELVAINLQVIESLQLHPSVAEIEEAVIDKAIKNLMAYAATIQIATGGPVTPDMGGDHSG